MADKPVGIVSPEIEKLSEKLQKDPNSKVFFNLAEEYYKGGMLEEAFIVLQTGLKSHPTYLSAKVLLGKIYLDQRKIKEAKETFEQILKINPDNIIVNKKLALIYFDEKSLNEAEKCCSQVLFFNSKDAEALTLLEKIKAFKNAPTPPPLVQPPSKSESVSIESASSQIPEIKLPETNKPAESEKGFDFSDIMKEEEVKPPHPKQQPSENGKGISKENLDTMALAELYIKQGHYEKGIEIYQKLLDHDPYNESVRQQLEDAKTIGNLLGVKKQPDKIEKNILETIIPSIEPSSTDSQKPPSPLSSQNQAKIARLKQWLENLKKVH